MENRHTGIQNIQPAGPSGIQDIHTPQSSETHAKVETHSHSHTLPLNLGRTTGTIVPGSGDGLGNGEECFLWSDLPMNKGYRYLFCSPSPTYSPYQPFYRTLPPTSPCPPVHLSFLDRSPFLRLSSTGLTCTAERGFRSARSNVSVRRGTWYYETTILRGVGSSGGSGGSSFENGNPHIRIGWGRREANLEAPVGMDGYSYSIRDVGGEKVHMSRIKEYGRSFEEGDVVGCLIGGRGIGSLSKAEFNGIHRKRVVIKFKGGTYFEMEEYPVVKEMEALVDREGKLSTLSKSIRQENSLSSTDHTNRMTKNTKRPNPGPPTTAKAISPPVLKGSRIEFFLNGQSLGVAFEDLFDFAYSSRHQDHTVDHQGGKTEIYDDGTLGYYPMVSCFGKGKLRVNFGPDWVYPPEGKNDRVPIVAKAMIHRYSEFRKEETALDERDE
ncbi:hypothetical protein TREMEDRAFT_29291, partial [Tremella mesenterica DSM 1558]|uniref:uncharacterized protein n=1 Tax=Tremella mesenterica (strain ATCC 24925 / CBS 8224 / DSM 1558 / NBRC 9311 / NRRL Y-6157 / RJB 2259-6 / UBC 559-6) TaxID=578456 RepID=UPI0003F49392